MDSSLMFCLPRRMPGRALAVCALLVAIVALYCLVLLDFNATPLVPPADSGGSLTRGDDAQAAEDEPACRWAAYSDVFPVRSDGPDKVIYVKTHKTGSSTISNVIARYVQGRGGNVFHVPPPGELILNEQYVIDGMRIDNVSEVSAFVNHIVYNETLELKYLAKTLADGTVRPPYRVTSVRDPRERLVSAYFYAVQRHNVGADPAWLCGNISNDFKTWVRNCPFITMNEYLSSRTWQPQERESVSKINAHYDHVFITEHMIQSTLVLASKIGLNLFDILIVPEKTNTRGELEDHLGASNTADLRALINKRVETNPKDKLDQQLYNTLLARHNKEFGALPESMKRMIPDLEDMISEVTQWCVANRHDQRKNRYEPCIKEWIDKNVHCRSPSRRR